MFQWVAYKLYLLNQWLTWKWWGSKIMIVTGFHCGLCGKWMKNEVVTQRYYGYPPNHFFDGYSVCSNCNLHDGSGIEKVFLLKSIADKENL